MNEISVQSHRRVPIEMKYAVTVFLLALAFVVAQPSDAMQATDAGGSNVASTASIVHNVADGESICLSASGAGLQSFDCGGSASCGLGTSGTRERQPLVSSQSELLPLRRPEREGEC